MTLQQALHLLHQSAWLYACCWSFLLQHFSLAGLFASRVPRAAGDADPKKAAAPGVAKTDADARAGAWDAEAQMLALKASAALGCQQHPVQNTAILRATSRQLDPSFLNPLVTRVPQMALKMADLGHLASSEEVHRQWVGRLQEVGVVGEHTLEAHACACGQAQVHLPAHAAGDASAPGWWTCSGWRQRHAAQGCSIPFLF